VTGIVISSDRHLLAAEPSAAVHFIVRRMRLAPTAASSFGFAADPPPAMQTVHP
jgi:hypothetical protein